MTENKKALTIFDKSTTFGKMEEDGNKEIFKKNMYDLVGYLPDELESLKCLVKEVNFFLEENGVEDFLKMVGRISDIGEKDSFVCGVLFGEQINKLLEERDG